MGGSTEICLVFTSIYERSGITMLEIFIKYQLAG